MFIRIGAMVILALSVMLAVYPLLHEVGHAAAALCFGAELKGLALYPIPHTDLMFGKLSRSGLLVTAFGGSVFPLIILVLPDHRRYLLYFIKLTVALITFSCSLTSVISVLSGSGGYDDAAAVTEVYPELLPAVCVISALLMTATLFFCIYTRPLDKTLLFLTEKRGSGGASEALRATG